MTKTILMIHGFGAAGDSWAPVATRFKAAGYAVETPTIHAALRTVGPPPAGLVGKRLADYVGEMSDLAQVLAARDGEKPVVFGHSMGGLIAQKLAEAGLVAGAVLFAPASPADARGKPKLSPVFTFLNIALTAKPETKAVKIWKTGFKWGVLNQTPADRHEAIFATTVHDSGRALSDLAYPERDPDKTVSVDATKVSAPLLILAGVRDRTTPIEDVRLVGQKYAGATIKEYADHAHWLIDEPGSARILDDVAGWLDANGLGLKAPAKTPAPKTEAVAPVVQTPVAQKPAPKPKAVAKPAVKPAPAAPAIAPVAKTSAATKAAPKPATKAPAQTAAKTAAVTKPAAKAAPKTAPKAKAPVRAAPAAATVQTAAKAPAKASAPPKAAPTPKVAKAPPKPPEPAVAPKADAQPKAPRQAQPTPSPAAIPKAAPKVAAKVAPKVVKTVAASKTAAPKPAPAKPAVKASQTSQTAKTAKTAVAPKAAATKSTAKSSPSGKKSV